MIEKFDKPILVTESSLPDFENYVERIRGIWDTKWLTNQGPLHNQLETELADYLKVNNITLYCNGHMALDSAIKAVCGNGGGKEVITTPFTFVSTVHAIYMNGLTPVFCDIKIEDYTVDETKIEDLITDKTVAIVATHVYGYPCNVEKISEIAERYNLKVIYDAAHAFGVEIGDTAIGNFGDVSMFSFHATKVFNTIEGGALVYGNGELKQKFNLLKNFGILNSEEIACAGLNAKMNEFQAAMGLENLKNTDRNIKNRSDANDIYRTELSNIPGIVLAQLRDGVKYNFSYMPVLVDEEKFGITRNSLYDKLLEYNVYSRKYFYPLISNIDTYKSLGGELTVANYVSERILCLPMSGALKVADVEKICSVIEEIYKENR